MASHGKARHLGRARSQEWRPNAPDGCSYAADELADLRGLYLRRHGKNEAFYRLQVIMEAKLGLAIISPQNPLTANEYKL